MALKPAPPLSLLGKLAMARREEAKDLMDPRNWIFVTAKDGRVCEASDPEAQVERRWWPLKRNAWEYTRGIQDIVWKWIKYAALPPGAYWKQWTKRGKSKWGRRVTVLPFKLVDLTLTKDSEGMSPVSSISEDLSSDSGWSWTNFRTIKKSRAAYRKEREVKKRPKRKRTSLAALGEASVPEKTKRRTSLATIEF